MTLTESIRGTLLASVAALALVGCGTAVEEETAAAVAVANDPLAKAATHTVDTNEITPQEARLEWVRRPTSTAPKAAPEPDPQT